MSSEVRKKDLGRYSCSCDEAIIEKTVLDYVARLAKRDGNHNEGAPSLMDTNERGCSCSSGFVSMKTDLSELSTLSLFVFQAGSKEGRF